MNNLILSFLAFAFAFFAMPTEDPDPYPGPPLADQYAAQQNCPGTGPPPPSGYHWAYDPECVYTHEAAHESGWRTGYAVYDAVMDQLNADIAAAESHLEMLEEAQADGVPKLQGQINETKVKIFALKKIRTTTEQAWTDAQAKLRSDFYEAIDDCCIQVQNG